MAIRGIMDAIDIKNGSVTVKDKGAVRKMMDGLIYAAVFEQEDARKKALLVLIKEIAKAYGAVPSSIQALYEEMGRDYPGFTVPAMNIRGLTYDCAKAAFRKAHQLKAGPMIFEIARSEIGYTMQRPLEYSAVVLAAAVSEGHEGPVFIQGDHFQLVRKNYLSGPALEINYVKGLITEAIDAEFYNIDIDTSTLVDLSQPTTKEQQRPNFERTAELAEFIRQTQPAGIDVSIGGEIGEIGTRNSTAEELKAYLDGFRESFKGGKGLSKLSIQTGTSHGGVVLPDGTLAKVQIDFETLRTLSLLARREYGLSGCVQHGASTLPEEAFHMFPQTTTSEVHLATGFQNIVYDSPSLPGEFRKKVYALLSKEFSKERKEGQTDEQFFYSLRKKGFGPVKREWWDLSSDVKDPLMKELEDRFGLLFEKLRIPGSQDILNRTVKPVVVKKEINKDLLGL